MDVSLSILAKPVTWFFGLILTLLGYIWTEHKKEVKANSYKIANIEKKYYSKEVIDLKLEKLEQAVEENTTVNKELVKSVNQLNITLAGMNGFSHNRGNT